MSEIDKHHLVFDRPHFYKCKCGFVQMIFISEFKVEEKTFEYPKNVEYMSCGHATCAKRADGSCIICLNRRLTQRPADYLKAGKNCPQKNLIVKVLRQR